jgi:hypothetical protein
LKTYDKRIKELLETLDNKESTIIHLFIQSIIDYQEAVELIQTLDDKQKETVEIILQSFIDNQKLTNSTVSDKYLS